MIDTTETSGYAKASSLSLAASLVNTDPGPEYSSSTRLWQGIPGIERTPDGRFWAVWYSGGDNEGPDNYVQLVTSDDGALWSDPILIIDPPSTIRAFDPVLWLDPSGRLWLFWAQSDGGFDGRAGLWAITKSQSSSWSQPTRIADGVMMNKPIVTSNAGWLLPVAVWNHLGTTHEAVDPAARTSHVVASQDQGNTWQRRGGVDIPDRCFDEHMIVERRDRSLWMLVRLMDGIGESVSTDGGWTWSPGTKSALTTPNARFFIRRTRSGEILLVKHHNYTGRSHLTAFLSDDDGYIWKGGLVLDERVGVSYPDGIETSDNEFVVIYDYNRFTDKQILTATFTRQDVLDAIASSPQARMKAIVNAGG